MIFIIKINILKNILKKNKKNIFLIIIFIKIKK